MKKIIVTGGAGFIGTNLIKRLLKENHDVISIDNYNTGLKNNHQKGCKYLEYDITTINDYNFIKPNIIYHLAAIARIKQSFKNPYTFSKDIGEEIIKLYQEHFNLKSSIVRFYNVYGPHQLIEGGYTTLIGRWLNNIKNDLPCEIYGDGEKRRDFTHVDDIVE